MKLMVMCRRSYNVENAYNIIRYMRGEKEKAVNDKRTKIVKYE
jgi:hypothetical protein